MVAGITSQGHYRMGKAKAYSVAAKRRARKGRPRKAGPREANGRIDRHWSKAETERAVTEVGLSARQRLYGLGDEHARWGEAGSTVGRMFIAGRQLPDPREAGAVRGTISKVQYDAANEYIVVRNAYHRAIGAKGDFVQPSPDDHGTGTYEDFCRAARQRYDAMQGALRDLMVEVRSPAPVSALDVFVTKDVYMAELEGDLKLALNRLAKHFFESARRAN